MRNQKAPDPGLQSRPRPLRLLLRGLLAHCPICGGGKLFSRWFTLAPRCPTCDYDFDREPGWWIGAMAINIAAAIALYGLFLPLGILLTWPDVPWMLLTVVGAVLMVTLPIVFYPASKTLWLAVDIMLNRMD